MPDHRRRRGSQARQLSASAVHLLSVLRQIHTVENASQEVVGFGVAGVYLNRPFECCAGAGEVAPLVESITEIIVGLRVIRLKLERSLKAHGRFLHQSATPEQQPQLKLCRGM